MESAGITYSSRDVVLRELELLARDSLRRIVHEHGVHVADIPLAVVDQRCQEESTGTEATLIEAASRTGDRSICARRQLAQLWAVLGAVHSSLASGGKVTQRELWYRLKTGGLFSGPQMVNDRVIDLCAAVSARLGMPVPRESLGVIAAPRECHWRPSPACCARGGHRSKRRCLRRAALLPTHSGGRVACP